MCSVADNEVNSRVVVLLFEMVDKGDLAGLDRVNLVGQLRAVSYRTTFSRLGSVIDDASGRQLHKIYVEISWWAICHGWQIAKFNVKLSPIDALSFPDDHNEISVQQ